MRRAPDLQRLFPGDRLGCREMRERARPEPRRGPHGARVAGRPCIGTHGRRALPNAQRKLPSINRSSVRHHAARRVPGVRKRRRREPEECRRKERGAKAEAADGDKVRLGRHERGTSVAVGGITSPPPPIPRSHRCGAESAPPPRSRALPRGPERCRFPPGRPASGSSRLRSARVSRPPAPPASA